MSNYNYLVRKTLSEKDIKPKRSNKKSTYFPIKLTNGYPVNKFISSKAESLNDYYFMLEFENYEADIPHFHIYEIGKNGRISQNSIKSVGISLESSINKGLIAYDSGEMKNNKVLDDDLAELIVLFVEKNRKILLLMFEAFRLGRVKGFNGIDEAYEQNLEKLFTRNELAKIDRKLEKLTKESAPLQFGETY